MTLVELQNVLGNQVKSIVEMPDDTPAEEQAKILAKTDQVSRLAKQMINNADVILRTDKLVVEGKIRKSSIVGIVGGATADEVVG